MFLKERPKKIDFDFNFTTKKIDGKVQRKSNFNLDFSDRF